MTIQELYYAIKTTEIVGVEFGKGLLEQFSRKYRIKSEELNNPLFRDYSMTFGLLGEFKKYLEMKESFEAENKGIGETIKG